MTELDLIARKLEEIEVLLKGHFSWPRWLPTKEATRYSGLSAKTLVRLYRNGDIYAANLGGGKYLFDRISIDEFFLKEKIQIKISVDKPDRTRL